VTAPKTEGQVPRTEAAGQTAWLLYDVSTGSITDEPSEIIEKVRCTPDTPRHCEIAQPRLAEIGAKIEKHIKNSHLKRLNAIMGVKPVLKAWMELN